MSDTAERHHIHSLEEENRRLRAALDRSITALDDWVHRYAPDMCDELSVADTDRRIFQSGGTLAYIADVQAANRAALKGADK